MRARAWCFTLNNYSEEEYEKITKMSCKYLVVGKEVGESGTPHLQGYVEFDNPRMLTGVKKIIGDRVHLEIRLGTALQASEYCKKDGEFFEIGNIGKQGERTDLKDIANRIKEGEKLDVIAIEDPETYCKYRNGLTSIEDICLRNKKRTEMTEGFWYYGETGIGKSHRAFEEAGDDVYVWVDDNGWWDGYTGQEVVIINDFRGGIKYNELLQLIDKWPYSVRRRGRPPMPFTSKKIIITSSLRPEDVYSNLCAQDSLDQLKRRIVIEKIGRLSVPEVVVKCTEVLQGNTSV